VGVTSGAMALMIGCSSGGDGRTERCRELGRGMTAEQAWEDIEVLQERVEEWLALDCEAVLGE